MKKTILTLLFLGGIASAATELRYWAGNGGHDLTDIEGSSTPWLGVADGSMRADASVITSITTKGNKDYSLVFYEADAVHFAVNDDLYFNQIYGANNNGAKIGSYTIDFGTTGSITAATNAGDWGGSIKFSSGTAVTLNIGVSAEQLASTAAGEVFTRTVINSTDTKANAMWNVTNNLTVNATGLGDYLNVGLVEDVTMLQAGQYGYMKVLSGDENQGAADGISLVLRVIPEPTTATLSLLALCGMAARRRRK